MLSCTLYSVVHSAFLYYTVHNHIFPGCSIKRRTSWFSVLHSKSSCFLGLFCTLYIVVHPAFLYYTMHHPAFPCCPVHCAASYILLFCTTQYIILLFRAVLYSVVHPAFLYYTVHQHVFPCWPVLPVQRRTSCFFCTASTSIQKFSENIQILPTAVQSSWK